MNKQCKHCKLIKSLINFNKCSKSINYRPECKECKAAYEKQNRIKNSVNILKNKQIWRKNNSEKVQQSYIRSKPYKKRYYQENREVLDTKNKLWYREHPVTVAHKSAKYRASKLNATPKWLTQEQLKEIEEFYYLAQELAWLNDPTDPLEVDHIIPLQGKEVCGLHVPWNLQILPRSLNRSKGCIINTNGGSSNEG